jgi:hypothetical protein
MCSCITNRRAPQPTSREHSGIKHQEMMRFMLHLILSLRWTHSWTEDVTLRPAIAMNTFLPTLSRLEWFASKRVRVCDVVSSIL